MARPKEDDKDDHREDKNDAHSGRLLHPSLPPDFLGGNELDRVRYEGERRTSDVIRHGEHRLKLRGGVRRREG